MGTLVRLLVLPFCAALSSCGSSPGSAPVETAPAGAPDTAATISWPPLPDSGFVTGRAATQADVQSGNAVFATDREGKVIGTPRAIDIPHYAFYLRKESAERMPVIVVQAERASGIEMIGYLDIATGSYGAGMRAEFELLGMSPPEAP